MRKGRNGSAKKRNREIGMRGSEDKERNKGGEGAKWDREEQESRSENVAMLARPRRPCTRNEE
jgi:hypothetical protein